MANFRVVFRVWDDQMLPIAEYYVTASLPEQAVETATKKFQVDHPGKDVRKHLIHAYPQ